MPAQIIVLRLLPHLDELAAHRRATLQASVDRSLELLAEELPGWTVDPPLGGSVLWPETGLADTGPFVQLAARHGVRVAPGSIATCGREADPHLRICVNRPWPHVQEGIRRLRSAWEELHLGAAAPAQLAPVLG